MGENQKRNEQKLADLEWTTVRNRKSSPGGSPVAGYTEEQLKERIDMFAEKARVIFDERARKIIEDYEVRMNDNERLVARVHSDNEMLEKQVAQLQSDAHNQIGSLRADDASAGLSGVRAAPPTRSRSPTKTINPKKPEDDALARLRASVDGITSAGTLPARNNSKTRPVLPSPTRGRSPAPPPILPVKEEDDPEDDSDEGGESEPEDEFEIDPEVEDDAVCARITRTIRYKEAEKVVIPKFPTVTTVPSWENEAARGLVNAGGRIDMKEIDWFRECKDKDSTLQSLANSGSDRFKSIDMKLATSMTAIVKDACNGSDKSVLQLHEQIIAEAADAWEKNGKILMGRQLVWLMYNFLRINPDMNTVYGIQDLSVVTYNGDQEAHFFLRNWDHVIRFQRTPLDDKTKEEMILTQLEKSVVLTGDIAHYRRQDQATTDRSYAFLRGCLTRYIARTIEQKNRANMQSQFARKVRGGPKAAPAPASDANQKKAKKAAAKAAAKALAAQTATSDAAKAAKAKAKAAARAKAVGEQAAATFGPNVGEKKICWFFNAGHHVAGATSCSKTSKDCTYLHKKVSAAEFAKMERPAPRGRSQSNDGGKGGKGKGTAKAKAKAKPKTNHAWCRSFNGEGGCPRGAACPYPHLTPDAVEACKQANANLKGT
jgi:hypothetical protein